MADTSWIAEPWHETVMTPPLLAKVCEGGVVVVVVSGGGGAVVVGEMVATLVPVDASLVGGTIRTVGGFCTNRGRLVDTTVVEDRAEVYGVFAAVVEVTSW